MTTATLDNDTDDGAPEDGDATAPAMTKRKRLILIVAVAVLLIGGGSGAWWWFHRAPTIEMPKPASADELVDVPPLTINLRTTDGSAHMLRVHVMLVPGTATKEAVKAALPIILDELQPFLRELRPEDVAGAAATFRVKEEMLVRANAAIGPGAVRDVLIQDLVQQ
jgi:flagellar FliL protein